MKLILNLLERKKRRKRGPKRRMMMTMMKIKKMKMTQMKLLLGDRIGTTLMMNSYKEFTISSRIKIQILSWEKKKFVMRPPQVVKVGAKKTAFVNFTEIAKMLHRQPKHLLAFLFAELGTTGAIDGNNQLVMKGKFQQKHIENVLRRYIKEYVPCHTCRSPDTILNKETRLFFLHCMTCNSSCSVQTIKTGFQAVTGKRSAIRAKQ